jgi:protocatechuate 3,4-dioxygenase beta subunit
VEPTKFVQYNHTQKYNSIDSATFSVYTTLWNSNHLRWKGINKEDITCGNNVYSKNQVAIFPACVDNFAVGNTLNLDSPCPAVVCPSFTDINCIPTPQDTLDYIPPPEKSPDSKYICKPDYTDDIAVPPPYYGMDEGIPPYFTPVSPTRLLITGAVIGSFGDKCTAINDAVIEAWQIDPTAITNYTARSEYLHNLERNLSATESQRYFQSYSSSSSAQYKPESLREISCRARQVVDSAGKYSFETIMPPSYGPPRHIVFKVTAPGFETLTTRMYFDLDWRLQQLTTLNDETKTTYIPHDPGDYGAERNIATDDDHNILHYSYYNNNTGVHVVNQTNEHFTPDFPGAIAKDPRVRPVSFVTTTTKNVVFGATPGYWNVSFNLVLKSNRPSDKGSNSAMPPLNLTGLWVDYTTGGMIKVETHGFLFIATEYPHPRTWGTASGILVGDTVRGVSFRKNTYVSSGKTFAEASIDGGSVSNDNYWASGYSTGNVVMKETFSSEKLSSLSSSEMSLEWSGGDVDSGDVMATNRWGKIVDSRMKSYRYLKLVISRETGGYQYGKMVINEIEFYEGILAQRIVPAADRKMVSPRTPSPQLVTCSSFQDQFSHCYKAFDGIETSNSAWITEQVGSFNGELGDPQWVFLDLGEARSIEPTAIRIVCGVDNTNTPGKTPLGCPRAFSLYGSFDNIQFDEVYSTDLLEYSNEYNSTHGKVFNFFWEAPTGRPNGHRCGSCTSGPLFTCNVDAYDGTCASKYCDNSGLCNEIPVCPPGEYMDTVFIDFNKPSMRCNQCAPGRYGNASGYTNSYCTGTCHKGYYCPAGSTSPTQIECGDNTVYCPEGSGYPVPTAAGRKSVGGEGINVDNSKNHHSDTLCSKGHYCENGIEKQCPVGRYGDMEGLSSFECTGLCLAGEYCNLGSIKPTLCEKGYYCPDGTIRYPCPVGRYGGVVGSKDAKCTGLCSPGYYCDQGSISSKENPCPAGRYSSTPGATSKNCDGLCTEGYYCPDASTSSVANECGDETVYCPAGSGKPIAVSKGYYSIGGSPSLRTNQTKCEPGFYCKDGIKLSCPAGSYGSVAGMSNLIPFAYNFTYYPTLSPTSNSNTLSTRTPTVMPSFSPTTTKAPTIPSKVPTGQPTTQPTRQPTGQPSRQPTGQPTGRPSRYALLLLSHFL